MAADYSHYTDPDYAADYIKIFALALFFKGSKRLPANMSRETALDLSGGDRVTWEEFIKSLRSPISRADVRVYVFEKFGYKIVAKNPEVTAA